MELRLTVWLKDGRVLSGVYPYLAALARFEFAGTLDGFLDARLEQVQ